MKITVKYLKSYGTYLFFKGAKNVGNSGTNDEKKSVEIAKKEFPDAIIVVKGPKV